MRRWINSFANSYPDLCGGASHLRDHGARPRAARPRGDDRCEAAKESGNSLALLPSSESFSIGLKLAEDGSPCGCSCNSVGPSVSLATHELGSRTQSFSHCRGFSRTGVVGASPPDRCRGTRRCHLDPRHPDHRLPRSPFADACGRSECSKVQRSNSVSRYRPSRGGGPAAGRTRRLAAARDRYCAQEEPRKTQRQPPPGGAPPVRA